MTHQLYFGPYIDSYDNSCAKYNVLHVSMAVLTRCEQYPPSRSHMRAMAIQVTNTDFQKYQSWLSLVIMAIFRCHQAWISVICE